jgi:hypothetical protein
MGKWPGNLFCTELVTKVKPNIDSVEVHNRHPVDGVVVGAGSLAWRNYYY